MMKKRYIITAILAVVLTACSHIDEDERYIYDKMEPADRTVLLEDFTGQRCVNCPTGTEVIEKLQAEFGEKVIAVGIHGGPLGFAGSATLTGLATDVGDEYYDHWNLEYQPVGLIDRHGAVKHTEWTKAVVEELAKPARLKLAVEAENVGGQIFITVSGMSTDDTVSGRLQVWVLEDGITAMQMMPDGSSNREYVHNHVLRTPVNGTWGTEVSLKEGELWNTVMEQSIDAGWVAENLSVVAFVYDDTGVLQAAKCKVWNP